MDSLVSFNLNMEREVETKDFALVGVVVVAAAATVAAKYAGERLVEELKLRRIKKLSAVKAEEPKTAE